MQTHLWTWHYTCVISPWESTEIKTKTISRSVFSLQNVEMNIIVHWKFKRKYGYLPRIYLAVVWIILSRTWLEFRAIYKSSVYFNIKTYFVQKMLHCSKVYTKEYSQWTSWDSALLLSRVIEMNQICYSKIVAHP